MVDLKQLAGEKAADLVTDGMAVGLGTGSTVSWTIRRLGERVRQGLRIRGIPTSRRTEALATEVGIPLTTFATVRKLDLTIDGADEVDPSLALIKGGGGALLREKLVAAASLRLVIVADDSKLVSVLGKFPLPVEVIPFAWEVTSRRIEALGCAVSRRGSEAEPFVSDNGNFILDCSFGQIPEPESLHRSIKLLPGVVETGLFVHLAELVLVGSANGVQELRVSR